ncbi:MAG: protein BatD, partial [Bacteroidales bacterium]|nr:protein BatD [Bacteroidales bacterium]
VTGQAQNVIVKPLPANRPEGFTGAVGSFEIKSVSDNDTVPVYEAVNLTVTISGKGNIRLADAPVVSFPAGLEAYDPKTTTNAVSRESGTTGNRVFEYLIIPRSAGDFILPAITWSYFDPEKGIYQVVRTNPINLHVTKGAPGQTGPQLYAPASGEEIQYLGKDIRFIRTNVPVLRKSRDNLLSGRTYYSIYGFSLLTFISVVLLRREQVKRNSDRVRVMNRRAGKVAASRLKKAQKHMQRDEKEIFYEEVLKALWGYVSDKLNIPVSQLTRDKAKEELNRKGADNQVVDSLMLLADTCELVRYAPSSGENEPQSIYDQAAGIIRKMEGQLN